MITSRIQVSCRRFFVQSLRQNRIGVHDLSRPCFSTSNNSVPDSIVEVERARPRRRRRSASRLRESDEIPSYKEFVHRFTVLSLYRGYLKEIRRMPYNQEELKDQVQREFKANVTVSDPFNTQRAITEGKRRFQELQEFTGSTNKYDGDSWLNTPDEDDRRGRVGTGWPWDR